MSIQNTTYGSTYKLIDSPFADIALKEKDKDTPRKTAINGVKGTLTGNWSTYAGSYCMPLKGISVR
jgi:hypothetical protein